MKGNITINHKKTWNKFKIDNHIKISVREMYFKDLCLYLLFFFGDFSKMFQNCEKTFSDVCSVIIIKIKFDRTQNERTDSSVFTPETSKKNHI